MTIDIMDRIRLMRNDFPVCPYCGYEEPDAWEMFLRPDLEDEGEVSCGKCEKDYYCIREVSVYYTTQPLEKTQNDN